VYILKVFAQIGRVFDGLSHSVIDPFEAGVACLCTIFDEWNASFVAMVWVVIMNMMWATCMWGTVCAEQAANWAGSEGEQMQRSRRSGGKDLKDLVR